MPNQNTSLENHKPMTPEQWVNSFKKETSYCHYFAVVIADDSSPIFYHPATPSEYFYTMDEAEKFRAELRKNFPEHAYLIISGMTSCNCLKHMDNHWAQQHKARLTQLKGGAA